ncbi:adenylate/guanylate cyclase domain-containing protein [Sulfurimonas microaerophilic]|uniref:adenylate/guanylate cyclase domain-containing protein n=1 Tax=Sulfurimonas microaerophilic TaxID=3058392 RepID=UPI0027152A85|nr:adenylate/guanylate cyclase domain-containing protein [Sulfurimonas sp. hsl 1-7]
MNDKHELHRLLVKYSSALYEEDRKALEHEIWKKFGQKKAVLVIDMSGFSRITKQYGTVHYLAMIQEMQTQAIELINSSNGVVVKMEADNVFAVFDETIDAISVSIALNTQLKAANISKPDEHDIKISIGIDYGEILLLDNNDFFGTPVNIASKLGEDLAGEHEILISQQAASCISQITDFELIEIEHSISGIIVESFQVIYKS